MGVVTPAAGIVNLVSTGFLQMSLALFQSIPRSLKNRTSLQDLPVQIQTTNLLLQTAQNRVAASKDNS